MNHGTLPPESPHGAGALQNFNGSHQPSADHAPFTDNFVICRLALAMINLSTKLKV